MSIVYNYPHNKAIKGMLKKTKQQIKEAKQKKAWRDANKEKIKEYQRAYRASNQEEYLRKTREYNESTKEKRRIYHSSRRKVTREYFREYQANRRESDPIFRLKSNMRSLIGMALNNAGHNKSSRTAEILGCDYDFFKAYIEQRFLPGMGWHNRSGWHLDHIIPVASAKTEKQILKLNHYTNFRPLWAKDNLSKGDKMTKQLTLLAA